MRIKALISTLDGHSAIVKAAKCIFDAVKPLLTHNLYKIGTVVGAGPFRGGHWGQFSPGPQFKGGLPNFFDPFLKLLKKIFTSPPRQHFREK
jgi:hypothetical protein